MSNKTAEDIKNGLSGVRGFFASLSGEKGADRNRYFNNPKSMYDELLIIFIILIWVCVGVTSYFGIKYHMSIFGADSSENAIYITGVSISFLIVGELVKVFIGLRTWVMILNGELSKGFERVVLVIFLILLLIGTYIWSFDISSVAFGSNQSAKERIKALQSKNGTKGVKESYQDRLNAIDNDIATAKKQTWDGKLVPKAVESIKASKKERAKVLDLIDKEMSSNVKTDSVTLNVELTEILKNEKRVNDYGGKSEILLLFSILCVGLIRKALYKDSQKDNDDDSNNTANNTQSNVEPKQAGGVGFNNIAPLSQNTVKQQQRNPIGFKQNNGEKIVIVEPNVISFDEKKKIN